MEFVKLHALGNDFIVSCRGAEPSAAAGTEFVRRICDRHTGVGADGICLVSPVEGQSGEFAFRIINADGSEAEISGNGLRCAMACLAHSRRVQTDRALFRTSAGLRSCEIIERRGREFEIRIEMGMPRLASEDIPFDDGQPHVRVIDHPIVISGKRRDITCVSMGNPHCDVFVDRLPARIEWHQVGSEIESHPFFPNRTNVEFVHVLNRGEIEVLFWERGVGETLASGSGACAAAVTSMLRGLTDRSIKVRTSLGAFTVEWRQDGQVLQTGPAEVVFTGSYPA